MDGLIQYGLSFANAQQSSRKVVVNKNGTLEHATVPVDWLLLLLLLLLALQNVLTNSFFFYFILLFIVLLLSRIVLYCIVSYRIDRFCINLSLVVSILHAHLLVSGGGFIHSFIHSLVHSSLLAEVELISNHVLGKGEFGVVWEVAAPHVSDKCPCLNCNLNRSAEIIYKQPRQAFGGI
jgi:uncharacterized integral membrane protein